MYLFFRNRNVNFRGINCDGLLQELCNYLPGLPINTVCLFLTYALCDILNIAMLNHICSNEIKLVA